MSRPSCIIGPGVSWWKGAAGLIHFWCKGGTRIRRSKRWLYYWISMACARRILRLVQRIFWYGSGLYVYSNF